MERRVHVPVLVESVLLLLDPHEGDRVLDLTIGGGGHAQALLERIGPDGVLVGLDRDEEALGIARRALGGKRVHLYKGSFGHVLALREKFPEQRFDAILADLGVSSLQLDSAQRGFSFRHDAPLDMRMDTSRGRSARDLVAEESEEELARIIGEYGEERYARRIARAIVAARKQGPLRTTGQLAEVVRAAQPRPGASSSIDPATRTFQALRIAVNGELEALDRLLRHFDVLLARGGRIAVLSYHSLEDRKVKRAFRERAREGGYDLLTPRAVRPTAREVKENPRARSARLRALRRRNGKGSE